MPTATVRDLRNNFARVSLWISNGEEVMVTKDGKPFARLCPVRDPKSAPRWPDLAARLRRGFPKGARGKPLSELVAESRGDR